MSELETITLDEVEYVRKDSIITSKIVFTGEKTIASTMIGEKVIVRSYNEGVNCGIVELADDTGVVLVNCRRLYYHKPKDKNTSWYEGVAMTGIGEGSKVSLTVNKKVIIEKYSMTLCTDESYKSIMGLKPNGQN